MTAPVPPRAPSPSAPSPAGSTRPLDAVALDLVALLLVIGLALLLWPRTAVPPGVDLPAPPWWGGLRDLLLEGPDAAQWAENAQRMADRAYDRLDAHRMPSWLLLVAAFVRQGWTVVEAGHVVNRAMFVVAAVGTYALGRLTGSRATGIAAAAIVLAHPHLQLGTQRFGIDASIEAMLPLALAAGCLVGWRWGLGLVAGWLAGWVMFLHHTTIPFLAPVVLLALVTGGPGWRRWAGAATLLVGAGMVLAALMQIHPLPTLPQVVAVVQEGAHPGSAAVQGGTESTLSTIQAQLVARFPVAVATLVDQMSGSQVPSSALFWLLGLGVVGPLLAARTPRARALVSGGPAVRRVLGRQLLHGAAVGVILLACLAPLPVLAALDAPPRYGNNLLGIVAVLVARGGVSALTTLEHVTLGLWARWPRGLASAIGAVALLGATARAGLTHTAPPPPLGDDVVGFYQLGHALETTFPRGAGVDCPVTEALMQAGLRPCTPEHCPRGSDEASLLHCVRALAAACTVDGTVGYVSLPGHNMYDPNSPGRPALDAWVAERVPPTAQVRNGNFSATLYRIPVSLVGP